MIRDTFIDKLEAITDVDTVVPVSDNEFRVYLYCKTLPNGTLIQLGKLMNEVYSADLTMHSDIPQFCISVKLNKTEK